MHVKARYCSWYLLEVAASADPECMARIAQFVTSDLGGTPAEAPHAGRANFRLRRTGSSLPSVFRRLESVRSQLGISDYDISMPTLEEVFLAVVGESLHN